MINRWKLRFAQWMTLAFAITLFIQEASAAKREAFMILKWEGRPIEDINLEAVDAFRKKYPEIPIVHLVNPSYFKEAPKLSGDNLEAIRKRIADNDEVGLYLVPSSNLVKAADVLQLRKPTFFSYSEEICTVDCGLSVPMTAYSRADVVKLVYTAHSLMREVGFQDMQSFAVHGFIQPAGVQPVAESLGYANDLTSIDKNLLRHYLKEYPIGQWLDSAEMPAPPSGLKAMVQAGGLLEFNNDEEVLRRFQNFYTDNKDGRVAFILSLSQENFFMNQMRLDKAIQGMQAESKKAGDELEFAVFTKGKKGRPIAIGKGISGKS